MTLTEALGLSLGANVGTTLTGWAVLVLGVRVNLSHLASPVLFLAVLARLGSRGTFSRIASVFAGLSIVLIGIDVLKTGLATAEGMFGSLSLPGTGLWGRLALMLVGILLTLITQSSSAGVATALVILESGHASFLQAAALVVGMTVGSTFTGVLASLGGTTSMRRAALAHMLFNLVQGLVALILLDFLARILPNGPGDAALALVMFHTRFTLIGALAFLPFLPRLVGFVEWLLRERPSVIAFELDRRFWADLAAATDLALAATRRRAATLFDTIAPALAQTQASSVTDHSALTKEVEATGQYLTEIRLAQSETPLQDRRAKLLSALDHLRRLTNRAPQDLRIQTAATDPQTRREACFFAANLAVAANALAAGKRHAETSALLTRCHVRLNRMAERLNKREARFRRKILLSAERSPRIFALTNAFRWLRRSVQHGALVLRHVEAVHR